MSSYQMTQFSTQEQNDVDPAAIPISVTTTTNITCLLCAGYYIKSTWQSASNYLNIHTLLFITKIMKFGHCCIFSGHSLYFFHFSRNENVNSH